MSEEAGAIPSFCAACGIAEIDNVKLKDCDGCDLVRYCSKECEKEYKSQHEGACKKRATELRDELLFKVPESSHFGDCPLCMLPLPIDMSGSKLNTCCSKLVCYGCLLGNMKREREERLDPLCPFCRSPMSRTSEEDFQQNMRRVEADDPVAMLQEGVNQRKKGDDQSAVDYFTKAAALGNAEAHYKLALMYKLGLGVEKDNAKEIHHLEEAAIGGHPQARNYLGRVETNNGNIERAVKHLIIAAAQGEDHSIKALMIAFKAGLVSKDGLAATLRAHQTAVDATKSPQREEAERLLRM